MQSEFILCNCGCRAYFARRVRISEVWFRVYRCQTCGLDHDVPESAKARIDSAIPIWEFIRAFESRFGVKPTKLVVHPEDWDLHLLETFDGVIIEKDLHTQSREVQVIYEPKER